MAVREVLQIGHPVLAARAEEVPVKNIQTPEVQGWVDDLIDTMRDANGAGIAANQIGIPHRLFVIEVENNARYPYKPNVPLTIIINPTMKILTNETFISNEGCLSVPQMRGDVNRHLEIEVSYYYRNGIAQTKNIRGYSACSWQHEYDHLGGILFPHRVTDAQSFCSWSTFEKFKKESYSELVRSLVTKWGNVKNIYMLPNPEYSVI